MKNDKQILIIEPERIVGLELQQQLEKEGFSVQRPTSLVDTEAIIVNDKPDLIIADTKIKEDTFFERIKKYLKQLQLPFIWISTLTEKETKQDKNGINVIGFFSKPFDSIKVVARIVNHFKRISRIK